MDKKYIYKQLDLIENEMKDVYDTMVEYGFNLTHEGLNSLIKTICIRTDNIKRELNKEYGSISKDINSGGFFSLDISKPGRHEVKEDIRNYINSLIK